MFKETLIESAMQDALEGPFNSGEKVTITLKDGKSYTGYVLTLNRKTTIFGDDDNEDEYKIKDIKTIEKA